jgi:hypothetical protein
MKISGQIVAFIAMLLVCNLDKQSGAYGVPQDSKNNASEQVLLFPFRSAATGKIGYIDAHGAIKIAPSLEDCKGVDAGPEFSEGRAMTGCVPLGYADATGTTVIAAEFDDAQPFSQGLAAVRNSRQKWGYINKGGKLVIPAMFQDAGSFSEGLAAVANENGEWGYIDSSGRVHVPFRFEKAGRFSQGLAPVALGGRYGFADKTGKLTIPAEFTDAKPFSEGLAPVLKDSWQYIDRNGKYAIPETFEQADDFADGLAPVCSKGKKNYVYINHAGTVAFPQQFERAFPFKNGLALVYLSTQAGTGGEARRKLKYGYIDRTGRSVFSGEIRYVQSGGSRGTGSGGQVYIPMTAVTIDSVPSGAKVYLIPLDDWESDKNLASESEKLMRYALNDYTPLRNYEVVQQVYRVFFELKGKRVARQFDVVEHGSNQLKIDFEKEQ